MLYLDRPHGQPQARRLCLASRIAVLSISTVCGRCVHRPRPSLGRFRDFRTKGRRGRTGPCASSRVGFDATGTVSEDRSPVPWTGRTTRLGGSNDTPSRLLPNISKVETRKQAFPQTSTAAARLKRHVPRHLVQYAAGPPHFRPPLKGHSVQFLGHVGLGP